MGVIQENIQIEVRTVIEEAGEKELLVVKQSGEYYRRNLLEVITYVEEVEDGEAIKNMISITPHKINIKRIGAVSMNQTFLENRITETLYRHPYGNIHMEIDTHKLRYESFNQTNKAQAVIKYTVKLNGTDERHHHLTLTFTKGEEE